MRADSFWSLTLASILEESDPECGAQSAEHRIAVLGPWRR